MASDRPRPLTQPELRELLDGVMSTEVRAVLRPLGFTKHGRTFRRVRKPLYDMIAVQGSTRNWGQVHHEFFVNVGVGSTEIDGVATEWPRTDDKPVREYLLDSRWWKIVPDLPGTVHFDFLTPRDELVAGLTHGIRQVVEVFDSFRTSHDLARWAARNNLLHHMEKTVAYLASLDDQPALEAYAHRIRRRMAKDGRWPAFNRRFADAAGPTASALVESGALDPLS